MLCRNGNNTCEEQENGIDVIPIMIYNISYNHEKRGVRWSIRYQVHPFPCADGQAGGQRRLPPHPRADHGGLSRTAAALHGGADDERPDPLKHWQRKAAMGLAEAVALLYLDFGDTPLHQWQRTHRTPADESGTDAERIPGHRRKVF